MSISMYNCVLPGGNFQLSDLLCVQGFVLMSIPIQDRIGDICR